MKLICRDSHATINGDKTTTEFPSGGLQILSPDGRTLFGISLEGPDTIRVDSGDFCKIDGRVYQDRFSIEPAATNVFKVRKELHPRP